MKNIKTLGVFQERENEEIRFLREIKSQEFTFNDLTKNSVKSNHMSLNRTVNLKKKVKICAKFREITENTYRKQKFDVY